MGLGWAVRGRNLWESMRWAVRGRNLWESMRTSEVLCKSIGILHPKGYPLCASKSSFLVRQMEFSIYFHKIHFRSENGFFHFWPENGFFHFWPENGLIHFWPENGFFHFWPENGLIESIFWPKMDPFWPENESILARKWIHLILNGIDSSLNLPILAWKFHLRFVKGNKCF